MHSVCLFVINDDGVWLLPRPQDLARHEVPELLQAARDHRWLFLYKKYRVKVADGRSDVARGIPFVPLFHDWAVNRPGTTYFLPVAELTGLLINVMLFAFSESAGYFIVDDRNRFRPAGLGKFARSRGGHLFDDPADARVGTVTALDAWMYEFAAIEQGAMLQNLALMTEALGLGGFPHFAAHPFAWPLALGFRVRKQPFSHTIGAGLVIKTLLRALKKDLLIPTPVGFERDGRVLIKPFCPPYYHSMRDAVLAFVEYKYAEDTGTLRDGGELTAWRDGGSLQAGIGRYSPRAIDATIACCEYLYERYGRIPVGSGPFRTVLAYQAHHLDPDFYDRFYQSNVLTPLQRYHDCSLNRSE
jgi:hypothetical protein